MGNRTTWVLDNSHSEIIFKVKHLMITNVKGTFRKFNATLITEGHDFSKSSIKVTVDAGSIDTNSSDRDTHLRGADFFDAEKYPQITFTGKSFTRVEDDTYKLTGDLTMKGVTKEVTVDVEFGGTGRDPWGNEKAGFSVHGKLNRKDWGLNWNATLETGGVLLSDEVKISADVQFVKQAEIPTAVEVEA
jgi:polyisoprenoid-binding protein YceI